MSMVGSKRSKMVSKGSLRAATGEEQAALHKLFANLGKSRQAEQAKLRDEPISHVKVSKTPVHLRLYLQGRELQNHRDRTHQRLGIHHTAESRNQGSLNNELESEEYIMNYKQQNPRVSKTSIQTKRMIKKTPAGFSRLNESKTLGSSPRSHVRSMERALILDKGSVDPVEGPISNTAMCFQTKSSENVMPVSSSENPPEVAALLEQIKVLKETMGLTDEDIKWRVDSTKGNAFSLASNRLEKAEEQYQKSLYEESVVTSSFDRSLFQNVVKIMRSLSDLAKEHSQLKHSVSRRSHEAAKHKKSYEDAKQAARIKALQNRGEMRQSGLLETLKRKAEESQKNLEQDQIALEDVLKKEKTHRQKIQDGISKLEKIDQEVFQKIRQQLISYLENVDKAPVEPIAENVLQLTKNLEETVKKKKYETQSALSEIETWRKRKKESKEYHSEMQNIERRWREDNCDQNEKCLARLRTLLPVDIKSQTADSLRAAALQKGVVMTYDLASYLKQNKFLHWAVTHPNDIACENFLAGDTAHFYQNFEQYDITELRAVYHCIPPTFEFDSDGRKNQWREALGEHLKILVKQECGEEVKGAWDPEEKKQKSIKLRGLSEKQALSRLYRYPAEEEMSVRLEKFQRAATRLETKQTRLNELLATELPAAKTEYDAVSADSRCSHLQLTFGKDRLKSIRNQAKDAYQKLVKEKLTLEADISNALSHRKKAYPNYEQYQAEVEIIREKKLVSQVIPGPFDSCPSIKQRETKEIYKKLSVAEEAKQRQTELTSAIAQRSSTNAKKIVQEEEPRQPEFTRTLLIENVENTPPPILSSDNGNNASRKVQIAPRVLDFLQKDFCSPRNSPTPSPRRRSIASPISKPPLVPTTTSSNNIVVTPKSNLIRKLLESQDEIVPAAPVSPKKEITRRPSFLAELKSRTVND